MAGRKKVYIFSALIILLISFGILPYLIGPHQLIDSIGITNGYIMGFVIAFFGGLSAGTSFSAISFLIALIVGGLNPFFLGLVAGSSLALGDTLLFLTGLQGRKFVKGKWKSKITEFANYFNNRYWLKKLIPLFSYIYMGFAPLPNDILILFLASIKYSKRITLIIIVLGVCA
jgi:hypothetical protein